MKNELAIKLAAEAEKYRSRGIWPWRHAAQVQSDYEDLMSIAGMIESNEDPKKIGMAISNLYNAASNAIPDDVYLKFTEV